MVRKEGKKFQISNDFLVYDTNQHNRNERKSEQAHIPHAPTLLENAVYNEWQFQVLVTGNWTKKGI